MIFEYQAKDKQGQTIKGTVEAPSMQVAADIIKEKKYIIISLKEKRKRVVLLSSLNIFNRVPLKEIVVFSRELSVMISSSVPLVRALRILIGQTTNINFKIIIADIADEVEGGAKLSTSLSRYSRVFDNFFVQMVRSGETTGKLDETLIYLADQKEKDYDFVTKIRGSMIYPIFVLASMFVVGMLMMIFVVPKLIAVLQEAKTDLPLPTKILIFTSTFFEKQWGVLVIVVLLIFAGFAYYRQTASGRKLLDFIKLHIPIIGGIYRRLYITRFTRSLSTLLVSGISLSQALPIVSDIVGNSIHKRIIQNAANEIEQGNSIASAFVDQKEIPLMVPQMMRIGEQTGRLDQVLLKVADFYTRETENLVANLVTLIEPIIMIGLGVAIVILMTAILLPMYNLSSAL